MVVVVFYGGGGMIICPKCGAENGKRTKTPVKCCRCWYQFVRNGEVSHEVGAAESNQATRADQECDTPGRVQPGDTDGGQARSRLARQGSRGSDPVTTQASSGEPQHNNLRDTATQAAAENLSASQVAHTIPEVTVASRLAPKPRTRCPRCEGKVIPWGPDVRCENCNQNFGKNILD